MIIYPNTDGFIYLMRNSRNGYTKIGYSKNPQFRERTLQSEEPEIELLGMIPGSRWGEQEFHKIFDDQRVRGEWFSLTNEDCDSIIGRKEVAA